MCKPFDLMVRDYNIMLEVLGSCLKQKKKSWKCLFLSILLFNLLYRVIYTHQKNEVKKELKLIILLIAKKVGKIFLYVTYCPMPVPQEINHFNVRHYGGWILKYWKCVGQFLI
jgi:hypothetical protein